jgi:peptide-methionine (S)-S-oxide reductase
VCSGRITIRRKGCGRATTPARSTDRASTATTRRNSAAEASRDAFQPRLDASGNGPITTEILPAPEFFYAEDYHQQYLAKNPDGYCGLGGTGVTCPIGTGVGARV